MKAIYNRALELTSLRIEHCDRALVKSNDRFEVLYWESVKAQARLKYYKINKRMRARYSNVIKVDFKRKRKVA